MESYSGHVTIPPSDAFPFEQTLFFWFFESRDNPAADPLTVWINGGPGVPSTDQAVGSNGPCRVRGDSETIERNPWSWNNRANLLYIDQPSQTGFSQGEPAPGKLSFVSGQVLPADTRPSARHPVLFDGVFGSQDASRTLNTTQNVARVMWSFMQAWLAEDAFRKYRRESVHLWSQS